MNNKAKEVYSFYKEMYPQEIMLFRVMDKYEAYFEDARKIAGVINHIKQENVYKCGDSVELVALPANDILDYVGDLSDKGFSCKIISKRNNSGEFSLPDTSALKKEREMDY